MKTETKAELRDRIAILERSNQLLQQDLARKAAMPQTKPAYAHWRKGYDAGRAYNKRATLAAYALLATLIAIIIMEVVL